MLYHYEFDFSEDSLIFKYVDLVFQNISFEFNFSEHCFELSIKILFFLIFKYVDRDDNAELFIPHTRLAFDL